MNLKQVFVTPVIIYHAGIFGVICTNIYNLFWNAYKRYMNWWRDYNNANIAEHTGVHIYNSLDFTVYLKISIIKHWEKIKITIRIQKNLNIKS